MYKRKEEIKKLYGVRLERNEDVKYWKKSDVHDSELILICNFYCNSF